MKFSNAHKVSTLVLAIAIAFAAPLALGQGKGSGGGTGGSGGKPPTGETAANNLSYPPVELNGAGPAVTFNGLVLSGTPALGKDYSFACGDAPELVGETTYPYTSCVNAEGSLYYTVDECLIAKPACIGKPFYRLYWQKTATNDWTADAIAVNTTAAPGGGYPATHVDWSDSLESQIWWDTAAIRVETTPYATLPVDTFLTGVTMWHVYGQGQTELWGAKALGDISTELDTYESSYAILHAMAARLNIAKISEPNADCVNGTSPGAGEWMVNPNDTSKYYWSGSSLTLYDVPYTPELNIGGRYVYGFNWQLRRDQVPANIGKTGWWRLTFYSALPGYYPVVIFPALDATVKNPPLVTPPAEVKFTPVVAQDLSYIDICVRGSKGGGGIKGGK